MCLCLYFQTIKALTTDFAFILWFLLYFPQSEILCLGLFLLIGRQNPPTPVLLDKQSDFFPSEEEAEEYKGIHKCSKGKVDPIGLSAGLQLVQHQYVLPNFSLVRASNWWSWRSLHHRDRICREMQKFNNLPLLRSISSKFSPFSNHI